MKINYFSKTGFAKITVLTLLTTVLLTSTATAGIDYINEDRVSIEDEIDDFEDDMEIGVWVEGEKVEYRKQVSQFEYSDSDDLYKDTGEDEGSLTLTEEEDKTLELTEILIGDDEGLDYGEHVYIEQGGEFVEDEDNNIGVLTSGNKLRLVFSGNVGVSDGLRVEDEIVIPAEYNPMATYSGEEEGRVDDILDDYGEFNFSELGGDVSGKFILDNENPSLTSSGKDLGSTHSVSFEVEDNGPSPLVEEVEEVDDLHETIDIENPSGIDVDEDSVTSDENEVTVEFPALEEDDELTLTIEEDVFEDEAGNMNEETSLNYQNLYSGEPEIDEIDLSYESDHHGEEKLVESDDLVVEVGVSNLFEDYDAEISLDTDLGDNPDKLELDIGEGDCDEDFCEFEDKEFDPIEFDGGSGEEVEVTVTDDLGNSYSQSEDVDTKTSFGGVDQVMLNGDEGRLETVEVEFDTEMEEDPDSDGWEVKYENYDDYEDSNLEVENPDDNEILELSLKHGDFPLESNKDKINISYSGTGGLTNKYGINIGGFDERTEIDEIAPGAKAVHWVEDLRRFAVEFSEPVETANEVTSCDNCEKEGVASNDETMVLADYTSEPDYSNYNEEGWTIELNVDTEYHTDQEVEVEWGESNRNLMPVFEGRGDSDWDLISVASSSDYVNLTGIDEIEDIYYFKSSEEDTGRWKDDIDVVGPERGVYVNADSPVVLEIETEKDEDEYPDIPETQSDIKEGLNLVSPVESDDSATRTAINWFSSKIDDFVSEIISPGENDVEIGDDSDLDEFRDDCWDDGDWEDDCDGEIVDDGFNAFEGYWINVEEN